MCRTVATESISEGRFPATSLAICFKPAPQSSARPPSFLITVMKWLRSMTAPGEIPWPPWPCHKWIGFIPLTEMRHGQSVQQGVLTVAITPWAADRWFWNSIKRVGAWVEVAAILALHLVAMSSGPGRKMKQSVSGVRYSFFFFFFWIPLSCLPQVHNDSDVICYSASRWSIWAPVESGWIITGGGKTMPQIKQNTYNGCGSDSVR